MRHLSALKSSISSLLKPTSGPASDSDLSHPRWMQPPARLSPLWGLLPWFVTAPLGKTRRKMPKVTSTTYLNGIRGLACMIVLNFHTFTNFYPNEAIMPYGADDNNRSVFQMPLLRLVFAGRAAVCSFFVLSGFVVSYSFLRQVNSTDLSADQLFTSLGSAMVRRPVRLFAPMVVIALLTTVLSWTWPDYIFPGWWFDQMPEYRLGSQLPYPSYPKHFMNHVRHTLPVLNLFTWDPYYPPAYHHCWTLPVEYRGSLVVYLLIMMTWRLSHRARKTLILSTAFFAMFYYRWDVFTFLSGMFLAELRFNPLTTDFAYMLRMLSSATKDNLRITLSGALLLVSLAVCCWPEQRYRDVAPYRYLAPLALGHFQPPDNADIAWIFESFGAVGVLVALENLPYAQALLSSPIIQYLGEVSYGVYLVHMVIYSMVGKAVNIFLSQTLGWPPGNGFWIVWTVIFALSMWLGDLVWRGLDEYCVLLSKRLVIWLGMVQETPRACWGESDSNKEPALPTQEEPSSPTIRLRDVVTSKERE